MTRGRRGIDQRIRIGTVAEGMNARQIAPWKIWTDRIGTGAQHEPVIGEACARFGHGDTLVTIQQHDSIAEMKPRIRQGIGLGQRKIIDMLFATEQRR